MSTTQVGDSFRDAVADLLRSAGYSPSTEVLVGHKRVDIIFEQTTFGRCRKYVVEAKNWKDALSKTDLEQIYGGYASIFLKRDADELLIVSAKPLQSPAAKTFINETPQISHMSFTEFQESLLGFRHYLQAFVSKHQRDGLEDYYVSPTTGDGHQLVPVVLEWLDEENKAPLAVIASYGMGKTSFAEHLTYILAKQFLAGVPCRVPVLIRLGMISREQSIEGLIGKVLAGVHPSVAGYTYPIFSRLNQIGRFLILFDGFDEMKHMMTHAEFIANFDELNKLVDGAAKVILLGRPTAFLSEDERISVLRGTRKIGKSRVRSKGAPSYHELNLRPFTPAQLSEFVKAYLARWQSTEEGLSKMDAQLLDRRRSQVESPQNRELLSRPIHARMMADLATDPSLKLEEISRFTLYDHFVDLLISRELTKSGRGTIYKSNDRRSFASDLAWYLWIQEGSTGLGCRVDELPEYLFEPYIPQGEEKQSARRDLLSGSFLDEKHGGVFFFSHKSFQEFLVSEYIWSSISDYKGGSPEYIKLIAESLTKEVYEFLIEQDDLDFFRTFMSSLNECKEGISLEAVLLISSASRMHYLAVERSSINFSTWDAIVCLAHPITQAKSEPYSELLRMSKMIAEKAIRKPMVILSAVNTLICAGLALQLPLEQLLSPIVVLLFARGESDIIELSRSQRVRSRGDALRDIIFQAISARRVSAGTDLIIALDLGELASELNVNVHIPSFANFESLDFPKLLEAPYSHFFRDSSVLRSRIVREFYERDAKTEKDVRD